MTLINAYTYPQVDQSSLLFGLRSEWYLGYDAAKRRLEVIPLEERGVYTLHEPLCTSTRRGMRWDYPNEYYITYHAQDGLFRVDFKVPSD